MKRTHAPGCHFGVNISPMKKYKLKILGKLEKKTYLMSMLN